MKRIFIVSLLALTVALGAVATGCSGGNNSSSTDKSSSKVESVNDSSADDSSTAEVGDAVDGDFVWDENSCIVNLSKEAAKKSEIVIPKKLKTYSPTKNEIIKIIQTFIAANKETRERSALL